MKLKIVKDTNPIMRKKSLPVELPLNKEDKELLDSMLDYLIRSQDEEYAAKHNIKAGVGMAAIQVGVLKRMFVIYYTDAEGNETKYQLVNPRIIETSLKKCALENGEGCLSVDKEYKGLSHRYFKIKMVAYDAIRDENIEITARGFDSIVLQHEYDHLDGILYYDRIDKQNPTKEIPNSYLI